MYKRAYLTSKYYLRNNYWNDQNYQLILKQSSQYINHVFELIVLAQATVSNRIKITHLNSPICLKEQSRGMLVCRS